MDTMNLIFGEAVRCKEHGVVTNTWSIRMQILQALRHVKQGMTEKEMVERLFADREKRRGGETVLDPGEPGNSIAWLLAQGAIAHDTVTGRWYTEVTPHTTDGRGTGSTFVVAAAGAKARTRS